MCVRVFLCIRIRMHISQLGLVPEASCSVNLAKMPVLHTYSAENHGKTCVFYHPGARAPARPTVRKLGFPENIENPW